MEGFWGYDTPTEVDKLSQRVSELEEEVKKLKKKGSKSNRS